MAKVREGRAGRVRSPGRYMREIGLLLLAAAAVAAAFGVIERQQESDLRDLDALQRAEARVVGTDSNRRLPDEIEVSFRPDGTADVRASIPYAGPAGEGDSVEVAYVRGTPSRVRTATEWSPGYQSWFFHAGVFAALGLPALAFGVVSRRRGDNRYEDDAATPRPRVDPGLGQRVAVSSKGVFAAVLVTSGLLAVLVASLALAEPDRAVVALVGAAGVLALAVLSCAGIWWWSGRDGVWVTTEHLVARRRDDVRRWPWSQVRELGLTVESGQARVPSAKVDDGLYDGVDSDGWITLAKPLVGPFAQHRIALQMRSLAQEKQLPYTEGLTPAELADGWLSRLRRAPK
jgi:hypothetical protein